MLKIHIRLYVVDGNKILRPLYFFNPFDSPVSPFLLSDPPKFLIIFYRNNNLAAFKDYILLYIININQYKSLRELDRNNCKPIRRTLGIKGILYISLKVVRKEALNILFFPKYIKSTEQKLRLLIIK